MHVNRIIKEYVISKEWGDYEELRAKVVKWAMVKRASQIHKQEHMEVDAVNEVNKEDWEVEGIGARTRVMSTG